MWPGERLVGADAEHAPQVAIRSRPAGLLGPLPGLADSVEIRRLAELLPVPLNVYVGYPGAPDAATLRGLGVRRISLGCGTMQAVLAHLARIAREALVEGRYDTMGDHMLSVGEANGLFAPRVASEQRRRA